MSENVSAASTAKAPAAKFGGAGLNVAIGAAAVATVVGLMLWGMQLSGGFMDTAMRDLDPWGISIALFMLFIGVSVGAMVVATAPKALGLGGFGGVTKLSAWIALRSAVVAVAFVVVDLGQPLRLWEMLAYSNLGSPLMWDIVVISVYLVLGIVYLWMLRRADGGSVSDKAVRIVSVVVFAVALVVIVVDGWIFGLMPARAMWHTALLAPWFVSSALVSGTAVVLVTATWLGRAGYVSFGGSNAAKLAKLLAAFVCVDLMFFMCDLVTEGFPADSAIVAMLVSGPIAPWFWTQIVCLACAALICLVPKARTSGFLTVAAVLSIVGVFCKRMQLIVGGFQVPAFGDLSTFVTSHAAATGMRTGLMGVYEGAIYAPTLPEIGLAVGVVSLGVLMLLLGLKLLPLKSAE